jgi:CRP-like cAMP-binding protein
MNRLRAYFEQHAATTLQTVPDTEWERFAAHLVRREFPAKTVLLEQGHTEQYISFIESGIVRFYYLVVFARAVAAAIQKAPNQ